MTDPSAVGDERRWIFFVPAFRFSRAPFAELHEIRLQVRHELERSPYFERGYRITSRSVAWLDDCSGVHVTVKAGPTR